MGLDLEELSAFSSINNKSRESYSKEDHTNKKKKIKYTKESLIQKHTKLNEARNFVESLSKRSDEDILHTDTHTLPFTLLK